MTKFLKAPCGPNRELTGQIQDALRLVPDGELLDELTASNSCREERIWGRDSLLAVGVMTVLVQTLAICRGRAVRKHYKLVEGPELIFIYEELANV